MHTHRSSAPLLAGPFFSPKSSRGGTKPIALSVFLSVLCLSTPGCVGPHGHSPEAWFALLASGAELPIPDGREPDYKALSALGDGALLFLSMHAKDRGKTELEQGFLFASIQMESGLYQSRAAQLLWARLSGLSDPQAAIRFALGSGGTLVGPQKACILEAQALFALGRYKDVTDAVSRYRKAQPSDANNPTLTALAAEALLALEDEAWLQEFRALLASDVQQAQYEALGRLSARATGQEQSMAQARFLAGTRDYGASVRVFRRLISGTDARISPAQLASFAKSLNRPAYSDLARAFLYGSRDEAYKSMFGLAEASQAEASASSDPAMAYTRSYWAGRFARETGAWAVAERMFRDASTRALSQADLDAALWYVTEAGSKQSLARGATALMEALSRTSNPGSFSDVLESISRGALLTGNGEALLTLASAADKATAADRARMQYLCARAAMEGIISPAILKEQGYEPQEWIRSRLEAARNQNADSWYRLAAAWWIQPDTVQSVALTLYEHGDQSVAAYGPTDARLLYAQGLVRFALFSRLRTEPLISIDAVPSELIREAAASLAAHEAWADSIRLAGTLVRRPGGVAADGSLFWPRPWPDLFEKASADSGIAQHILYALARSESLFQPAVVSMAGAVGLTQLMPATAEETAGRLRIESYTLTEPWDNLMLGSSYLKRMLSAVDGRLLEAVYAYNAGLSRARSWKARAKTMALDLLLETLDYEETRQYGRNIATASIMYASLYGGQDPAQLMSIVMTGSVD